MIRFTKNADKALQTLLWILNRKPGISKYHVMKVMFDADCYHLNVYGSPIYGEEYIGMKYGTVPSFMKDLMDLKKNVPFVEGEEHKFVATSIPDMSVFSDTNLEALEHGIGEYADLSFEEVLQKNHAHPAWKKQEEKLNSGRSFFIPWEDLIENPEVLADLQELGDLTESMSF